MPADIVPNLIAELQQLQQAKALLEQVWAEIGPYSKETQISNDLQVKLQTYFKWDDSE